MNSCQPMWFLNWLLFQMEPWIDLIKSALLLKVYLNLYKIVIYSAMFRNHPKRLLIGNLKFRACTCAKKQSELSSLTIIICNDFIYFLLSWKDSFFKVMHFSRRSCLYPRSLQLSLIKLRLLNLQREKLS